MGEAVHKKAVSESIPDGERERIRTGLTVPSRVFSFTHRSFSLTIASFPIFVISLVSLMFLSISALRVFDPLVINPSIKFRTTGANCAECPTGIPSW